MEQKIPTISNKDVKRIIEREFPRKLISDIESILGKYVSESKTGRNRVYVSILKLSNGNIEEVSKNVEKANNDFRDIISLSEYPNYSKHAFEDLTDDEEKQLIDKDWNEFQSWLNK